MRKYTPPSTKPIPPEAKKVFTGEIFEVYQWPQKMFDGSVETFEMLRRPDTVRIIAVKDGKIVVIHQRQPQKDWFYDFPGGRHDHPDEDELAAAKRELLEETGLRFKTWRLIDAEHPVNKIDWLVYTFLATDFESAEPQQLDSGEEIEVEEYDFDNLPPIAHTDLGRYDSLSDLLSAPELFKYN